MKTSLKYFLFLLFSLNCIVIEGLKCKYKFNDNANGWLKFQEIPATWYDARLRCALEGAILASPTTPSFLTALTDLMNNNEEKGNEVQAIFTGIHATISKGDYFTVDGIPLSEIPHQWESFEPNNLDNNEDCITISNDGYFSDEKCSNPHPYFCFKSKNATEEMSNCGIVLPEYEFEKRTNSCYKFHTVPRTFSRAFFTCSAEGGHLAIVNSGIEAIVLKELFAKNPNNKMVGSFKKTMSYVGIYNWGEQGDWRTIHRQTLKEAGLPAFTWSSAKNRKDLCGSVTRGGIFNDVLCDQILPFICEKEPVSLGACYYT